ncbi:MAG: WYL domain-containing protein [Anaerofustis stercorihominis]|nr:WYL domain-containing protein [Anaerofustis stercorihominis]
MKKSETQDIPVNDIIEETTAAEATEDAAAEKKKTTAAKKLLILYVLEVLQKYSDRHHKLTQAQIISLIKRDYDMDCERKAISRHIRSLIDHGYKISTYEENGEGYYIGQKEFTPEDAFMLWEGLMSSKYISKEEISSLVDKLSNYCGIEYRFGSSFYGGIISRYTYPESFIYHNIMILLTEMAANKKVSFIYNEYNTDKMIVPTGGKRVVSPYAVVNIDNEYYLAAKEDGKKKGGMSCFKVRLISNIETTSVMCDDIKNIPGHTKGFDVDVFANDFIPPFMGEKLTCHLRVNKENIEDIIEAFGDSIRIIDIEDDKLIIEVITNEERMYRWAIANAHIAELTEPQLLRFRIKDYFDINSWKYR